MINSYPLDSQAKTFFEIFHRKLDDDMDGVLAKVKRLKTFMTSVWPNDYYARQNPQDDLMERVSEITVRLIYMAQKSVTDQQMDVSFSGDFAKHQMYQIDYERAYSHFENKGLKFSSVKHYFPISHDDKTMTISKVILCGTVLNQGNFNQALRVFDLVEGEELVWLYPYKNKPSLQEWVHRLKFHCELNQYQNLNVVRISLINQNRLGALFLERCNGNLGSLFSLTTLWNDVSLELKRDMILQIGEALIDIHQRGHILWDLKPDNILYKIVGERILVKLADLDDNGLVSCGRFDLRYSPLDVFSSLAHPEPFKINSWHLGLIIIMGFMDIDLQSIVLPKKTMLQAYRKCLKIYQSGQAKEYYEVYELFKTTEEYKKCERHFLSLFKQLQTSENPMADIVLKLMDLDFRERSTIQQALEELKELWNLDKDSHDSLENNNPNFPSDGRTNKEKKQESGLMPLSSSWLSEIPVQGSSEMEFQESEHQSTEEPIYANRFFISDRNNPLEILSQMNI